MASFGTGWIPPTAHEELQNRIATLDRDIKRYTDDANHADSTAANCRETIAQLEALKVDYENVVMLAFSKAAN